MWNGTDQLEKNFNERRKSNSSLTRNGSHQNLGSNSSPKSSFKLSQDGDSPKLGSTSNVSPFGFGKGTNVPNTNGESVHLIDAKLQEEKLLIQKEKENLQAMTQKLHQIQAMLEKQRVAHEQEVTAFQAEATKLHEEQMRLKEWQKELSELKVAVEWEKEQLQWEKEQWKHEKNKLEGEKEALEKEKQKLREREGQCPDCGQFYPKSKDKQKVSPVTSSSNIPSFEKSGSTPSSSNSSPSFGSQLHRGLRHFPYFINELPDSSVISPGKLPPPSGILIEGNSGLRDHFTGLLPSLSCLESSYHSKPLDELSFSVSGTSSVISFGDNEKDSHFAFAPSYMFPIPVVIDSKEWLSVEHYVQAQKFIRIPQLYEQIRCCATPSDCIRYNRNIHISNSFQFFLKAITSK